MKYSLLHSVNVKRARKSSICSLSLVSISFPQPPKTKTKPSLIYLNIYMNPHELNALHNTIFIFCLSWLCVCVWLALQSEYERERERRRDHVERIMKDEIYNKKVRLKIMDTKMGKKRKWSYFTFFWFVNEKQALPLSDDREWKAVKTSRIRSRRKENKKLSKFQKKTIYIWFVS